jgi:capsular polysaccharide biosynthesis protein
MTTEDRTAIDVGGWMRTLAHNWWIVLGLTVLGAVAGGLLTLASPNEYTAASSVYIGQTTDANGNPMAGLNSNSRAATELLSSQVVLNEAARRTGMGETAANLRQGLTVSTPSQVVKATSSIVNIVNMSVKDAKKARATKAANVLAEVLLEHIGSGVEQKITLLQQQLSDGHKQLTASQARSKAAQQALAVIAKSGGTAAERSAAAAPYVAVVQAAASEQESLTSTNQRTQLLLLTAEQVEQPRVLHEAAVPDSPSGPDLKLNVAAGALAGLVIGIIVAFARRRFAER